MWLSLQIYTKLALVIARKIWYDITEGVGTHWDIVYHLRSKEQNMDGAKILYIEDNVESRILVKRVLEVEGYVMLEADDGIDGLRAVREETPDLILIDINLPEIDGYEITTRLRQMEDLTNIPIVALTANVLKGDRERSLEAGCDGYIQKPIDVDLLPAQIAAFLRQARQQ